LAELRAARLAEPHGTQLELATGAPRTFAAAVDEWERRKEYRTPDGAEYGRKTARIVRTELGAYALVEFVGVEGEDRLLAYKRSMERERELGPRTVRNRFSVLGQVLKFAHRRRWLASLPVMPEMPQAPKPRFEWIDEATFRALRAALNLRNGAPLPKGETWATLTARRKFYLSWLFYTGAHRRDADLLTDEHLGLDVGIYIRHNNKSARVIPDEQFEMPEPLVDDARELLAALGREAFYCGEPVAGGRWGSVDQVLGRVQVRAGIPGARINTRILRRSFAREMLRRGYTLQETADRMGHSDLRMLREVYTRTPRAAGSPRTRWTRTAPRAMAAPNTRARVVQFQSRETITKLSNEGE
jgi:integrase